MFKKVILSLALLTPFTGMGASATATDYESFIAADGTPLRLRTVTAEDFKNPIVTKSLSDGLIANRLQRFEDGEAGLFVVESEDGEVLGRIGAGGMPLGFKPGKPTSNEEEGRSTAILSFYAALVRALGQEIQPTLVEDVLHINPEILALTVAWMETADNTPGPFSTISAQEAIVRLVKAQGTKISKNGCISQAGIPSICLSITTLEGLISTDSTQVYEALPYFDASQKFGGRRFVVVTPMTDGVTLPKPGDYPVIDFSSVYAK